MLKKWTRKLKLSGLNLIRISPRVRLMRAMIIARDKWTVSEFIVDPAPLLSQWMLFYCHNIIKTFDKWRLGLWCIFSNSSRRSVMIGGTYLGSDHKLILMSFLCPFGIDFWFLLTMRFHMLMFYIRSLIYSICREYIICICSLFCSSARFLYSEIVCAFLSWSTIF